MWWLFRFLFWGCFFFLPFYRFWFCCQRMKKYKMQKVYLTYKYIPIYDTYREWQKFFLTCLQVYVLILILLQEHLTNVTPICPLMLWQSYNRRCCTSKTGRSSKCLRFWRMAIRHLLSGWFYHCGKTMSKVVSQAVSCLFRFMWRKHPQFDEIGMTMISSLWSDSVPASLDAVYQNVEKNLMVFFKGSQIFSHWTNI